MKLSEAAASITAARTDRQKTTGRGAERRESADCAQASKGKKGGGTAAPEEAQQKTHRGDRDRGAHRAFVRVRRGVLCVLRAPANRDDPRQDQRRQGRYEQPAQSGHAHQRCVHLCRRRGRRGSDANGRSDGRDHEHQGQDHQHYEYSARHYVQQRRERRMAQDQRGLRDQERASSRPRSRSNA